MPNKKILCSLLVILLILSLTVPVYAEIQIDPVIGSDGEYIINGISTYKNAPVSILVEDGQKKCCIDQGQTDNQGNITYGFKLDEGKDYICKVRVLDEDKEISFSTKSIEKGFISVRAEGAQKTLLPRTEVEIIEGKTTLLEVIKTALDNAGVKYKLHKNLLVSIAGEEGWQWMVNNQGGMIIPDTLVHSNDEIVLIDDEIWDPVITRLILPQKEVKVKSEFTAKLEQFDGTKFVPLAGKAVTFEKETKTTDREGQVTFIPTNTGEFTITSEPGENYIRPVPVLVKVSKTGGGSNPDEDEEITVSVKIKGYKHDVLSEIVTVKVFSLDPYLRPGTGSSAKPSQGWDVDRFKQGPTAAHATIESLKKAGFTKGKGKGHYDFQDYGWSCYFAMIDGDREKQYKATSGWLYKVNGKLPAVGCQAYRIKNGDEIYWYFNINATDEVGGGGGKDSNTTSGVDTKLQGAYDKLCNNDISEQEAVKIVSETVANLQQKVNTIKTKKDAEQILKESKIVFKIIGKALERVDEHGTYEKMQEQYRQVWKIDKLVADKLPEAEKGDLIKKGTLDNLKQTAELLVKMPDSTYVVSLVEEALVGAGQMAEVLPTQGRREIEESTQNLARKALEQIGTKTIPLNSMEKEENKAIVTVKEEDLTYKITDIIRERINLKQKITENKQQLIKELPLRLIIDATEGEANIVETKMTANTLGQIFLQGIKEVRLKTQIGAVNLTKRLLGKNATDQDKDVVVTMTKVAREELPFYSRTQVPQNNIVFDLGIKIGDRTITELQEPVKTVIPYNGRVNKGERISVYRLKNNGEKEALGGIYDAESKTVTFLTESTGKFYVQEENKTFKDLKDCAWAQDVIETMAGKGLIVGKSEEQFSPQDNITRAEFAALITRMLRSTDQEEKALHFIDVAEQKWYKNSVEKAYGHELMKGKGENIFDPEGKITRQEIAAVISNVLQQQGYLQGDSASLDNFTDKGQIADWAKANVALAAQNGIIAGNRDGSFAPQQKATRAEAAVMLYRLYKLVLQ